MSHNIRGICLHRLAGDTYPPLISGRQEGQLQLPQVVEAKRKSVFTRVVAKKFTYGFR